MKMIIPVIAIILIFIFNIIHYCVRERYYRNNDI